LLATSIVALSDLNDEGETLDLWQKLLQTDVLLVLGLQSTAELEYVEKLFTTHQQHDLSL